MEYCPYGDLKECYLGPVSEPEAREICSQLLEGLAVLHSLSIVHRDIKPEACPLHPTTDISRHE